MPTDSRIENASQSANWHRWLVVVAVAGAALVVGPPEAIDGIMVAKATLVWIAAIVALGVAAMAGARRAHVLVPRDPAVVAAVAFAVLLTVVAVLDAESALAFFGSHSRWSGAALYLTCVVLFAVAASRFTVDTGGLVLRAVAATGGVLGVLAIIEAAGLYDFGGLVIDGSRATLGNPNFLAGWLAVAVPVSAVLALDRRVVSSWRIVGAVSALAAFAGAVLSLSAQGPVAAAVALAVVGLVWLGDVMPTKHVRTVAALVAVVAVVVVGLTIAGIGGGGPLSSLAEQAGVEQRAYYWEAAASMVADEPVSGVGLGDFEQSYRLHRPVEAAVESALAEGADAAHSVPLQLAATGGVLVLMSYLAWLLLVAWSLWRGLRALGSPDRLVLGGIGAGWLAYVLQSLISIDVPPLAVVGWVLGGLVIALGSDGRMWDIRLPWAPTRRGRSRSNPAAVPVVDVAAVVCGVVLLWFAMLPLRAEAGATSASVQADGTLDPDSGVLQAASIAAWEPAYGLQAVRLHLTLGDQDAAQAVALELAEDHPRSLDVTLTAARITADSGATRVAEGLYRRALELEPLHPALAVEVAEFADTIGDPVWAKTLLERALEVDPDNPDARALSPS